MATPAKVDLALELERIARARDPRVTGVRSAAYADSRTEVGARVDNRDRGRILGAMCRVSVSPLLEAGGDTQIGYGDSGARAPSELELEHAAADGVDRAARLLGATKPPSRRLTVVLDPEVTAAFLSIIGSTLSGDAVLKGRLPVREPGRRAGRVTAGEPRQRSDRSPVVRGAAAMTAKALLAGAVP